jgi:hypothetical protein
MKPIRVRNNARLARISTVIVFLALIRTLSEPFRLHHYSSIPLTYEVLKPYITGALIASIALFMVKIYGCSTC